MNLSAEFTYPASLSAVREMLIDPHYRVIRAEGREVESKVDSKANSGEFTVVSTLALPPEVQSGPAAKVLGGATSISVKETIGTINGDSFDYEITNASPDLPISGLLHLFLKAEGNTTAVTVSGSVKVNMFLIGPMVENAIAGKTNSAIKREIDAARRYLAE